MDLGAFLVSLFKNVWKTATKQKPDNNGKTNKKYKTWCLCFQWYKVLDFLRSTLLSFFHLPRQQSASSSLQYIKLQIFIFLCLFVMFLSVFSFLLFAYCCWHTYSGVVSTIILDVVVASFTLFYLDDWLMTSWSLDIPRFQYRFGLGGDGVAVVSTREDELELPLPPAPPPPLTLAIQCRTDVSVVSVLCLFEVSVNFEFVLG